MSNDQLTRRRLQLQGFACDIDPQILTSARWLRFTPTVSAVCIAVGAAARSPAVLWGFAVIAAAGAAGWHPFDALFNGLVRRVVGAPPLPPNPPPRRFSMAIAAAWSAGAAWLMSAGWVWTGVVASGVLALIAVLVATTHFCLGSWIYQLFRRQSGPTVAA